MLLLLLLGEPFEYKKDMRMVLDEIGRQFGALNTPLWLRWLDMVGVFAFAFLGSREALRHGYNLLGMLTCGFVAAFGGGTVREVMLNHTPFYLRDASYVFVVLAAVACMRLLGQRAGFMRGVVGMLDAIGSIAFAVIGARAAYLAHLGMSASVFFALLTACGGGAFCDVLLRRRPRAFCAGWYTVPPLVVGFVLGFGHGGVPLAPLVVGSLLLHLVIWYATAQSGRLRTRAWLKNLLARRLFPRHSAGVRLAHLAVLLAYAEGTNTWE